MADILIKQVEYSGKEYYYKSPIFQSGLNIVEGKNGTGKTTFIDLICYALGDYVEQFDSSKVNKHREILSDIDNYVEVRIIIDEEEYYIRRYIKDNNNKIFVQSKELSVFDIKRQGDNRIFSDWLLEKLDIQPVEIYQGRYKGKINFTDILRLIHYDQLTNPEKIYKAARLDGNFISDSLIIRKAIFEILVGEGVIDYYWALNDCVDKQNIYTLKKSLSDFFVNSTQQIYGVEIDKVESFETEIKIIKEKILEKENEQREILEKEYDQDVFNEELSRLRESLIEKSFLLQSKQQQQIDINKKICTVQELIENRNIEVDQLEKIIFTHKELNLFAPNTCPYCFKKVTREEGHCVCGEEVEETSFQRYFYDTKEYVDMLVQRKKSLTALNTGYIDLTDEEEELKKDEQDIKEEIYIINERISKLRVDGKANVNNVGMRRVASEIANLENDLRIKQELQNAYVKYSNLNEEKEVAKQGLDFAKTNLGEQEKMLNNKLDDVIKDFSTIYNTLLTSVLPECTSAYIDKDYMPVINEGTYINASGHVPKRIVYFLSLLKLSLSKNVKFPHLLIIDTPENLGIDEDNLIRTLKLIEDIGSESYQIILTTGEKKYPVEFQKYVRENLSDRKLLKRKN